jgi:type I restriction enzyme R subunit
MSNFISEDEIEKAAVDILTKKYKYRTINCFTPDVENLKDKSNRSSKQEVVFLDVLHSCMEKLNPEIPKVVLKNAVEQLTVRRSAMNPLLANKEVYELIREGIPVEFENSTGLTEHAKAQVIDFSNPDNNDFCAVTQLWIQGDFYPRRPDVLIYINGLPLVFIELKNSNVKVKNAYEDNLTNYKKDVPKLFHYNAFCVLSNAIETKIGSFTSGYEFFYNWLRVDDESEKIDKKSIQSSGTSLEKILHGLFPKNRLLDYIENFILYYKDSTKIIAQNHQFLGVNKAIESFKTREGRDGRLGVFWHTQGSGKSFSMIFISRKIFRKFEGNYTFVIITDREDLDGQIYRNFLDTNTVSKNETARPRDSKELREFLGRNLRIVFTLIQKFRYDKGKEYPLLSDRKDIIVIVDEAHRSQYEGLADNMRKGLKYAQFFAFTGTPILGKGENLYKGKTYNWFGDYISQYNFLQSIDDGATVPIYYQKRVPEVLIQNENLNEEFYQLLEEEKLDEKATEKLEKEFSTELEVIKRDDRLDTIAKDIVEHFPSRGYLGKGMVISVDKFTSIKMYDKVQKHWKEEIKILVGLVSKAPDEFSKKKYQKKLEYMRSVEMAVVVSEEAGEEEKFKKLGLDILVHRYKMHQIDENGHDIEYRFKDVNDKLQLVFICAMWLTGFDAPTVSTLYLDKPMKGHTLMQTIARANRVTSYTINGVNKINGEVVDYYNVFRNMKKALSEYALGGEADGDEKDVPDKTNLFSLLNEAVEQGIKFCNSKGIDLYTILNQKETFAKVKDFESYANKILEKDEYWKEFKVYENTISSLYEACKPEVVRANFIPIISVFQYLRGVIEEIIQQKDIDSIRLKISELLDQSVVTSKDKPLLSDSKAEFQIVKKGKVLDLSKMDFEKLKKEFKTKEHKHIEIICLREFLVEKLEDMLKENSTRINFAERLQNIINNYNAGGMNTENYYDDLMNFAEEMKEEEERHIREGLTKDELELFDILKKEKMTKEEEVKVKNAAKHLLKRLLEEQPKVLIQDWFKDKQSQVIVKSTIEAILDEDLPDSYDRSIFSQKTQIVYNLILDYSTSGQKWAA